jgi:tetratricopeptide (TPR) repeat protein
MAHLLIYLHDRQLSGTLELSAPDGRSTVVFAQGRPTKARVHVPVPYLGRILLELGLVQQDVLDATLLELAKTRRLHGRILLERGHITPASLRDGLRAQLYQKLDPLFDLPPETTFEYFADYDGLADYGGTEEVYADPYAAVWRGVRRTPPWDHVQQTLAHLGTARIRMAKTATLERFELGQEMKLVEVLRAQPMTLYELLATELVPPKTAQLLMYTFAITKQIGLVANESRPADDSSNFTPVTDVVPPSSSSVRAAVPPAEPSSATRVGRVSLRKSIPGVVSEEVDVRSTGRNDARKSEPPPGTVAPASPKLQRPITGKELVIEPGLAQRRKEILERAAQIDKENYFDMLGVPRDATPDVIRGAYFQLARVWHPDRLSPEIVDVKPACAKVFARLSEAHQTLSDEQKRKQYLQQLAQGSTSPDEEAEVQAILEATLCFQKAEICFKRNDMAQAETLLRRAIELDKTQADYVALLAWVESLKPHSQSSEGTLERIRELDAAVALNGKCERAYFYRAMLYKRIGNDQLALRDFKLAFELNPRNVDAQREVRLIEMRKGDKKEKDGKEGGLLSRWFKK